MDRPPNSKPLRSFGHRVMTSPDQRRIRVPPGRVRPSSVDCSLPSPVERTNTTLRSPRDGNVGPEAVRRRALPSRCCVSLRPLAADRIPVHIVSSVNSHRGPTNSNSLLSVRLHSYTEPAMFLMIAPHVRWSWPSRYPTVSRGCTPMSQPRTFIDASLGAGRRCFPSWSRCRPGRSSGSRSRSCAHSPGTGCRA